MKNITVIPNELKDKGLTLTRRVIEELINNGAVCAVSDKYKNVLCDVGAVLKNDTELFDGADSAIVLGGDGTVLRYAETVATYDIPLLGINLGRIGYMASLEPDKLGELQKLLSGQYYTEPRMMIKCAINGTSYTALNDIVFSGERPSRMIDVMLYADGVYVCSYSCTCLIMATPTGSSAYNMSAGGAVIDPSVGCIAVTPVCPHSLSPKNLIFSSDTVLTVKNVSPADKEVFVSPDGKESYPIGSQSEVIISRSELTLKLISFGKRCFAAALTDKIKR